MRRYITNDDYLFRPEELERFPLYFFSAACCPVLGEGSASLQWYVYSDPSNGSLKRHPNYMQGKRVMSLRMPGIPLQDPTTGEELYYYPYNIGLRTSIAWLIPNLLGRLPSKPDVKNSTCVDKGSYALFIMLLFRPRRFGASLDYLETVLHTQHARSLPEDAVWLLVYGEYLRWRKDDIDAVAAPFLEKSTSPSPLMPRFDTTEWWA